MPRIFWCIFTLLLLIQCRANHDLLVFKENGKYGLKSGEGKVVVPAVYDEIDDGCGDGYFRVKKTFPNWELWGLLSPDGEKILDPVYSQINEFSDSGIAIAEYHGKFGCINTKGKTVAPFSYYRIRQYDDSLFAAELDSKWGIIDGSGKIRIPFEYQEIGYNSSDSWIKVRLDYKYGFIDSRNNIQIPIVYEILDDFSEGLAFAQIGYNRCGYINRQNNPVIPFIYEMGNCDYDSRSFHNGKATVAKDNLSGFINKNGQVVIPLKYYCIRGFCKGLAYVEVGNGYSWINDSFRVLKRGYVDTNGVEFLTDYVNYAHYDWQIGKVPAGIPDSSYLMTYPMRAGGNWTMERVLGHAIQTFRSEPASYPDLCKLNEVCIAYGLFAQSDNYENLRHDPGWKKFKEKTLFKMMGDENLRRITWDWIRPYYKKAFQTMNSFEKKTYREIAHYLKKYIRHYNKRKVAAYLKRDERRFAYYDMEGNYDPNRKLSAFIDRQIIIHKTFTMAEARKWIDKIAGEVETW